MRVVVSCLMILHGVIHTLGFVEAFQLAKVPQLAALAPRSLPIGAMRALGILWLVTASLFIAAAIASLSRSSTWWQPAAAALVLSQMLIICAWDVAKAGTWVNLVLLIPVVVAAAEARFTAHTARDVQTLLASAPSDAPIVQPQDLRRLPPPVARWLLASGVVGKPRAASLRLWQTGALRTSPDGPAMPARAEQFFRLDEPGFVWSVKTRLYGVPIAGRDAYLNGHGHMRIALASLIPLVDARDARIDEGTLQRFLAEMVWFPSAALREYVRWEPSGDHGARAIMQFAGVSAACDYAFDEEGRVSRVSAQRYLGGGANAKRETWTVPVRAYGTFDGVLVPSEGSVVWKLPTGDFDYFDWQITGIEYGPASPPSAATRVPAVARAG